MYFNRNQMHTCQSEIVGLDFDLCVLVGAIKGYERRCRRNKCVNEVACGDGRFQRILRNLQNESRIVDFVCLCTYGSGFNES